MALSCITFSLEGEEDEYGVHCRPPLPPKKKATKPRGGGIKKIFQIALLLARSKPNINAHEVVDVSQSAAGAESSTFWKSLLCSVRPLHGGVVGQKLLVENASAPVQVEAEEITAAMEKVAVEEPFKDATTASPLHSSVDGMSSTYTSAEDLHVLLGGGSEDDEVGKEEDENNGAGCEPNEIDVKAEEFIQNFYEEMKMQQMALDGKRED